MTHADKYFRNATDEELVHNIFQDWCEVINCECQIWRGNKACDDKCEERVLEWLREEAQEDAAD